MKKLNEKEWEAQPITTLFDKFVPGKGKGLNHLKQGKLGVNYIGATNRNNGVLCVVVDDEVAHRLVQSGNCIGFIKNGDGAAGFAIYKKEPFISTSDVIYGYANWLNLDAGLFFIAAQDMIESKYSHGYKRNQQHLRGDRVMLPVDGNGKPDYGYMAQYASEMRRGMLMRYRNYVVGQLSQLEYKDIPALDEKEWKPIAIASIFSLVRGRESNMAMLEDGDVPLISAKNGSNGLKEFVETPKKLIHGDCITLNNDGDGGAGLAYYQPANMALDTHVTALVPKLEMSNWTMLFIAECISGLHGFFGHGLSISNARAKNVRVMLPVDDNGEPDYAYMAQYAKNMMLKKYEQYLAFLCRKEEKACMG